MERKTIGAFIAVLRKSSGMTQKDLAEKLNVSDKTISHWERDESAPDISVVPVIAEIFGVTCDELLRGEKAPETAPAVTSTVKGEKQVKYLLEKSFGKLRIRQIICAGITLGGIIVGRIAAEILRLFIFSPHAPFMVACAFFAAALILGIVFHMSFISSMKNNDFEEKLINSFKLRANSITSKVVFWTVVAAVFSYGFTDTHWIDFFDGFAEGMIYAAIPLAVCIIITVIMKYTGVLPKKKRNKTEKKLFKLRILTIAVTAIFIVGGIVTQLCFNPEYTSICSPKAITFHNHLEFKDFMETPKERPTYADKVDGKIASVSVEASTFPVEDEINADKETNTDNETNADNGGGFQDEIVLYYSNGVRAISFKWLNGEVSHYEEAPAGVFPIRVYTYKAIYKSNRLSSIGDTINSAAYVYYPLVVIIGTAAYLILSKKIKNKEH